MAKKTFLDFEHPIGELEAKIEELRYVQTESAVDISEEIDQLSKKSQQLTKDIDANLTPWQITKIARHPERHQGRGGHPGRHAGDPDAQVRETLIQLDNGSVAHISLRADSEQELATAVKDAESMRFLGPRLSNN